MIYAQRDSNTIYQSRFEKLTYGKNTFKNYGTYILNLLRSEIKESQIFYVLKVYLMAWKGLKSLCKMCNICI